MAIPLSKNITVEQYLLEENAAVEKHEYYKGEVFGMAGATKNHVIIQKNLIGEIYLNLKNKPCQPYGSDLRIHISSNTLYTYPDITIICGDLIEAEQDKHSFTNPTIIIEVLSASTRDNDMGRKFRLYQDIPALKEYVLVDSEKTELIRYFINHNNNWEQQLFKKLEDTVTLEAIAVSIKLVDIYKGIEL
jgi:Uma2 family endonuclease